MNEPDPLRARLLQSDEGFRQLAAQHEQLDLRLRELSSQLSRTGSEEQERLSLKKRKLRLKDRMELRLRRERELHEAAPSPSLQSHSRG